VRPQTLAEAVERIQGGVSTDVALAEFVDTFDLAPTIEAKYLTIEREPPLTQDQRLDAWVGAMAEYLQKPPARSCPALGWRRRSISRSTLAHVSI